MAEFSDAAPVNQDQALAGAMLDLSAPQPNYAALLEAGGFVDGGGVRPELQSRQHRVRAAQSRAVLVGVDMSMGNVRPMIPLNVDPPNHSKYRKLLDPMFAPRRMEEEEEDITRRANGFIDAFTDRGECNFTEEIAELFPASIFLGLLGLPEDQMRLFLDMRDYILHPSKFDPAADIDPETRRAVNDEGARIIYDYFTDLIEQRRASLVTTSSAASSRPRWEGTS